MQTVIRIPIYGVVLVEMFDATRGSLVVIIQALNGVRRSLRLLFKTPCEGGVTTNMRAIRIPL